MKEIIFKNAYIVVLALLCQVSTSVYSAQTSSVNCISCCDPSKKTLCLLSKQILQNIDALQNQLAACCSNLEMDIAALQPCGPIIPIRQVDIPFTASRSAYYCAQEDLFFDGITIPNPGILGPIGIAVTAKNAVIDLNNHTLTYRGPGSNGIAMLGSSAHVTIKNGTIVGPADEFTAGILILTSNITVENVRIRNASGFGSGAILIQGATVPSVTTPQIILTTLDDILIKKCDLESNFFGIILNTFSNSVTIKDCTINKSVQMGIIQPSRKSISTNVSIDNCTISNSGLNGIYTTFSQANWQIHNCTISNSVLNGMILEGFQNLKVTNCQVFESGAHGIIASIRQSQNVEIADCQIFNCKDAALRVDNTSNLTVTNCQLTNYLATTSPLLKLQDIFNGTVSDCKFVSGAGTSDGLLLRNCHGLTIENSNAQILCNQPHIGCPIGFNLQGNVEATVIKNCTVSGNPSIGIALQQDTLNGPNTGVIIENCVVKGAVNQGILLSSALNSAVFGCQVINGQGDGILLNAQVLQCSLRDNTLINNGGIGINNLGSADGTNRIYHNFAQGNNPNYANVPLVTPPANNVGVLNNISN